MRRSLVLTIIGPDRPGIVAELAELASAYGASWQQSRMARVAGQFAGIACIEVPDESCGRFERALRTLESEGLQVTIGRNAGAAREQGLPRIVLELVGHDREGIVRDVSDVLSRHRVNFDELETEVEDASMSGERLFRARAELSLPRGTSLDTLRADLETIADELMVDLHLESVRPETE